MPNSLQRQRRAVGDSAEVTQLKKELEDLKASYARDVALISADIREIASRVDTPATPSGDSTPA